MSGDLVEIVRLIGQHQTGDARDRLAGYLAGHPDDGRAEFLLGLTYHREKRYGLARPHFETAARLDPGYHPTYHFLGWCLYYLGEPEAARRAFERHLELEEEGDSHYALGLIAFDADRLDEAERRYRRAIELQEGNRGRVAEVAKAHARLADVHLRRDELEQARAELEFATGMWPQHYAAFYKLSMVLARLGEQEAAQRAFDQYRYWEQLAETKRGVPGAPDHGPAGSSP